MVGILLMACTAALALTGLYGLYHVVVGARCTGELPALPPAAQTHRFAVLVFARNEERVIGHLLASLEQQDYPAEAFDVFVTADNCTDRTAEVARRHGAVVLERQTEGASGKGAALNWFFAEHFPSGYDGCVVFDADNVVEPGFLAAMNRQLDAGHPIAVGYRMGKNPSSSWVAGASSLFWLLQTRFFHLPRALRNLPCTSVGGTGFMFDPRVLGSGGWRTSSACEDIEFTLAAIASGHFVALAQDAVFYDEQPLTFAQSLRQRYRWSVGSMQLVRIAIPGLAAAVRARRVGALDAIVYILGVSVGGISGVLWLLTLVLGLLAGITVGQTLAGILVSAALSYVVIACFALLVARMERVRWPGLAKAVLGFPLWLLAWSVINVVVLFYRDPTWHVVPHTENLSLSESTALTVPTRRRRWRPSGEATRGIG